MPTGRRLLIVKRWILHEQKHTVQVSINIHCDPPCAYWFAHWRNHDHTILAEITGHPLILICFNHSQASTYHISQHLQQLKVVDTSFSFSWATEIPLHHITWQLTLSPKMAVDWSNFVRDICAVDVRPNPRQLGGFDSPLLSKSTSHTFSAGSSTEGSV